MPNSIVFRPSFCCVVTRRKFPVPKMPSIEPSKSPEANRQRLLSCAVQLDLRAFAAQMAKRARYQRCSHRSSSISTRDKIFPKFKKRKSCSNMSAIRSSHCPEISVCAVLSGQADQPPKRHARCFNNFGGVISSINSLRVSASNGLRSILRFGGTALAASL